MPTENWIFAYGSLIFRADFPFLERCPAVLGGWTRRFWQGSHDHRGTPDSPGRVVTLVPDAGSRCRGVAYRVTPEVYPHLDHRESNGYERHGVALELDDGREVAAVVYIAPVDNFAYLGPAPLPKMVQQIAAARGPSGANADYLRELADALRALGENDEHVFELARRLPPT